MSVVSSPIVASFSVSSSLASICTKTDSRYALSRVFVEPAGSEQVRTAVTDGRCLAIRIESGKSDGRYLVPGSDLKSAHHVELNGEARITYGKNQTRIGSYCTTSECTFPPIDDAIPKEAGPHYICFNAELLLKVAKAINDGDPIVTIAFDTHNRPISVMGKNGIGVLMPYGDEAYVGEKEEAKRTAKVQAKWRELLIRHCVISPEPAEVLDKAAEDDPERFEQVA